MKINKRCLLLNTTSKLSSFSIQTKKTFNILTMWMHQFFAYLCTREDIKYQFIYFLKLSTQFILDLGYRPISYLFCNLKVHTVYIIKEECKSCVVWYILSKYWMMLKAIHIALYYSSRMIDTL